MYRHCRIVVAAVVLIGLVDSSYAQNDVVVTSVVGKTEHRLSAAAKWAPARIGTTLQTGSQLRTGPRSKAEMLFPDRTTFRLGAQSVITIRQTEQPTGDLSEGNVFAKIVKGSFVRVRGRYGTATVRGTSILYETTPTHDTLRVWGGSAEFTTDAGTETVGAGTGSIAEPGAAPTPPRPIAPVQFGGGKLDPEYRDLKPGLNLQATQGTFVQPQATETQALVKQVITDSEGSRQDLSKGAADIVLQQVNAAGVASDAGSEAILRTLGLALTGAGGATSSASGRGLERQTTDWLTGPVSAVAAYGIWGESHSAAGLRAKTSAVAGGLYLQAAGRLALATGARPGVELDETFVAARSEDATLKAGRFRLLESPIHNSDSASLLPFSVMDGAYADGWICPDWRGSLAWLDDFDPAYDTDRSALYGRLQRFMYGGWVGVAALKQSGDDTGVALQWSFPVGRNALELYGEVGDDPSGNHIENYGIAFPGLVYDNQLDVHLEYSDRSGFDQLASMQAYWEVADRRWVLGTVEHSELDGWRLSAGVAFSFEGL